MVESLTPWVVPVHDTRGSETTSLQVWCLKQCHASKTPKLVGDCYSGIYHWVLPYPLGRKFRLLLACFSEFQVQIFFV